MDLMLTTKHFTWNAQSQRLTAEISEVQFVKTFAELMAGFDVASEHTGVVQHFTLVNVERDREGDVICWNFRSAEGTRLVLLND